jgi:hypothetical protein
MALPTLIERVASTLFGAGRPPADSEADRQLIADVTELVVDAVEPRLRMEPRYREKLAACVRTSIAYLRSIGRQPLEPVLLSRKAWSDDPRLNAFFATANDVPACLGRSRELRAFFGDSSNRDVQEAYALLGMKKEERTVLAPQLEGDKLKHDVAQVTVSFTGHRLVAPSATLAATRLDVGRRIIQRLAQVALSRIVALGAKATELEQRKAYLSARVRMLKLQRNGMEAIVKDPASIDEQVKAVERELKEAAGDYVETKTILASLDGQIGQIDEVLSHPEQHVSLTQAPLRVSRLGIKVDQSYSGPANELCLAELAIGEDFRAAIAIVRCPRGEVPPEEDLIAKAEHSL